MNVLRCYLEGTYETSIGNQACGSSNLCRHCSISSTTSIHSFRKGPMYRIIRNTLIGHQRFPHLLRSHHALDRLPAPALARTLPPSGGPGLRQRHLQDGLPLGDLSTHRQPRANSGCTAAGDRRGARAGTACGRGSTLHSQDLCHFPGSGRRVNNE
jgi:hypothetical protein